MLPPVSEQVEVPCAVTPEQLWPLVSDTNRLNQESGLGAVQVRSNPEQGLPRHLVTAKFGPLTLEWAEFPFEWQAPHHLCVRREVRQGLVERITFSLGLNPTQGGCVVRLEVSLTPRHRTAQPVAAVAAKVVVKKLSEGVRRLAKQLTLEATPAPVMAPQLQARQWQLALERVKDGLPSAAEAWLPQLVTLVTTGADYELARIRPYELADTWGAPRRDVLQLCLHASVAGVVDLSWDVICPSCRTATQRLPDLGALDAQAHCDLCDVGFGVDLDQAVEASFRVSEAVRPVGDLEFCTGGPGSTPHVVAQTHVHASEPAVLCVPFEEGRYRLFVRGGATASVQVEGGSPKRAEARFEDVLQPAQLSVAPGGALHISLGSAQPRHVKLEHLEWSSRAATAYEVTTVSSFRRLFSREALKPGLGLQIRRAALMFSDLSASTALYAREGDAAAFRLVQDHFDLMQNCIERHNGAVVKTIGDAVMASFVDERSALAAALDAQRSFVEFRPVQPASEGVFLKIGVYGGACYAVSANGVLDFFGQTVNVAARLQGQAGDGRTVATRTLFEQMRGDPLLANLRVEGPLAARLKGVEKDVEVVRLGLYPEVAG